jgi:hypothetical protein
MLDAATVEPLVTVMGAPVTIDAPAITHRALNFTKTVSLAAGASSLLGYRIEAAS